MDWLPTLLGFLSHLAGAPARSRSPHHRSAAPPSGLYARDRVLGEPSRTARTTRTTRQHDGDEAEAFARRYLECAGLTFVAANVRYRDGEIDLVMREPGLRERTRSSDDRRAMVFVEVRRRARDSHGGAAASITSAKRRRLVAAASHYLVGLGLRTLPPCRFDVVAVEGDHASEFRVEWLRNAFQDDGR